MHLKSCSRNGGRKEREHTEERKDERGDNIKVGFKEA